MANSSANAWLKMFLKTPLGTICGLVVLTYWVYQNRFSIKNKAKAFKVRWFAWLHGHQERSLWYENEGREEILVLISRLTAEGKNYCNLANEIKLPPVEHWYAISKGLSELGIITQCTLNSFYIMWKQPETSAGEA